MKKSFLFASIIAAAIALPSLASADDKIHGGKSPEFFGPVTEVMMMGHMMHVQTIEAADGGHWVVLSRAEAEMLLGSSMDKMAFTKLK